MTKLRWYVFSENVWMQFCCGSCYEESVASKQLSIFSARYPDRAFIYR